MHAGNGDSHQFGGAWGQAEPDGRAEPDRGSGRVREQVAHFRLEYGKLLADLVEKSRLAGAAFFLGSLDGLDHAGGGSVDRFEDNTIAV